MRVLLPWLREFVPIEASAAELAEKLSLLGLAVDRVEGEALELDLTSNRPDCLSHYGVAREIGAASNQPLAGLEGGAPETAEPCPVPVTIENVQACGRYCVALLEDVRVAGSPAAIAERLEALGQRAINNFADLTNYTLWEMGHPTHAFDANTLRGGEIRVRQARAGETLVTLDAVERKLDPADLVIADRERPIALAGIMGGLETAISARTRRVALESAWFDPGTVRRSARRHGLHTDASHRFERGADPEAAPRAARRLLARAQAYGARPAGGVGDVAGAMPCPAPIRLRAGAIERILGKAVGTAECERILQALGCVPTAPGIWTPPSWRPDLTREIDLIEEIARLHGYERFPARLPAFRGAAAPLPEAGLRDRVRRQLRGRGFAEAVTLSFASAAECRQFSDLEPVQVLNPLSEEAAILRTSSLPAMLHILKHNLHHGVAVPRLFEIGKVYALREPGHPEERAVLSLGACGTGWDFRELKGEVEAMLDLFAMPTAECAPAEAGFLHPGRSARFGELARFGQIHPELAAAWKLPPETWLAEVALERLYALGPRQASYRPPARFPGSERDFSFVFADAVSWSQVAAAVQEPAIPALAAVWPVEVFRAAPIPEGYYSLLVRARFQSGERTLREEEVQAGAEEIAQRLRGLGGVQR